MQPKQGWMTQWLVAAFLMALTACEPQASTGSAQLLGSLQQAVSSTDVSRVVVTLSAADLSTRTETLAKTDGLWGGTIGAIPSGTERTFTAEAFDPAGTLLFKGQARGVTITAGTTTVVAITLQQVSPSAPFENTAPRIDSVTASSSVVATGGSLELQATAHDPDLGDTLSYSWTASAGGFYSPFHSSSVWAAPTTTGPVTLTLTVTDSKGAATALSLTIQVQAASGGAAVNVILNTWPEVARITASPTNVAVGETTVVLATASDNDGDTLRYEWAASCAGSWTNATSASARFTPSAAPPGTTCGACSLSVTVTDGRGGQTTGKFNLCVGPKPSARFPPLFTSTYQSSSTVPTSGTVTFRVTASDPQDSPLTFAWSTGTGTLGTPVVNANQSEVGWSAPSCVPAGSSPSITARVTNGLGLSATTTFTVSGVATCSVAGWARTSNMSSARQGHVAALLPSGKVLVAGGYSADFTVQATAELYDPTTGTWTATGSMTSPREEFTAATLPSGRILVTGGNNGAGYVASAEVYDPATGTWTVTGSMALPRAQHTMTVLPSGKVLLAGGYYPRANRATAEVYDPATGTWAATGSMASLRASHTATLLPSGKVLVTGGDNGFTQVASAELYDPATGTWTNTGGMSGPHYRHTATLLPSGNVLVAGGTMATTTASAELYDPATGTWKATGGMMWSRRGDHTATPLASGKILVSSGDDSGSAELYDPATGTWAFTPTMTQPRKYHEAVRLPSGKVLAIGGFGGYGPTATAEVYTP